MSYVNSLFAEICKANNIAASKTALKAKRVKQLLKEVWPDLKFIQRKGFSDLICASNMKVEDALSKSLKTRTITSRASRT